MLGMVAGAACVAALSAAYVFMWKGGLTPVVLLAITGITSLACSVFSVIRRRQGLALVAVACLIGALAGYGGLRLCERKWPEVHAWLTSETKPAPAKSSAKASAKSGSTSMIPPLSGGSKPGFSLSSLKSPKLAGPAKAALLYSPAILIAFAVLGVWRVLRPKPDPKTPKVPKTRLEPLDVKVCDSPGGRVVLKHMDRYTHALVVGTTGTGKTSRVLKPLIYQDIEAIARGQRLGITVIEPKGSFAAQVAEICRDMGVSCVFINPEDPNTPKFNPLEGPAELVPEIMRTVLQSLFGQQEAFFRQAQEVAARNATALLKKVKGDDCNMQHLIEVLRDENTLRAYVAALKRKPEEGERSALVQYFEKEVLGAQQEKMQLFTVGLRLQLESIVNSLLSRVLIGKSDINLDRHLSEGGVLVVNTAMGQLGKNGDVFGQFVAMHVQHAVFRRPGNERTRTPHFLYIDEFPRYVNPDFERLLAVGREFRCATTLAVQSTSQLVLKDQPNFKDRVLETCRNKIVLTLGSNEDARYFEKEFGQYELLERQEGYKYQSGWWRTALPESYKEEPKMKPVFEYTYLMRLPKFHAVVSVVRDGQPLPPVLGELSLSPYDLGVRKKANDSGGRPERAAEPPTGGTKEAKAGAPQNGGNEGVQVIYRTDDEFLKPPSSENGKSS